MIVSIKLSIPHEHRIDAQYFAHQLEELSRKDYPGFVHFNHTGLKGTSKRIYPQAKRQADEPAGKLFS